ncbi:ATPase, partial [Candidatus Woesearchaeota archaeon CG_4_10_14_0_2_um_filter_57_5]
QVVDTVIFIQNGMVGKVLSLSMQVKVPAGMTEADLARPIVVVTDFLTNKPEYELYSYGEETVVVPVKGESAKPPAHRLASAAVEDFFLKYSDRAQAEVVSDNKAVVRLPADCIARVIGKGGENIQRIEEALGISIDIEELQSSGSVKKNKNAEGQATVSFRTKMSKRMVEFFPDVPKGNSLNIYVDGDFLMSAKVSNNGAIKIRKDHKMGKLLTEAVEGKADIKLTRA